ncbi:MAG: AmmeMemoRadiSam system protein B [Gammaproteobacteria bacterium]|nr:AmmeMemoRadiSam system protein B [Gammaproteobacteria bacterium]
MGVLRYPNVAGTFYPADPRTLAAQVRAYAHLGPDAGPWSRGAASSAGPESGTDKEKGAGGGTEGRQGTAALGGSRPKPWPKALIVPHAGYLYSGPVAGSAYAQLAAGTAAIRRVVLLGPSHRLPFYGLAYSQAEAFVTPLGQVPVDREAFAAIADLPQARAFEAPFQGEHCLEVQLPFLQVLLEDFRLVPFLVGEASTAEVAEVLERLWGGDETLILVSSDLSHYLNYATARRLDAATSQAIVALDPAAVGDDQACGRIPVKGLLRAARHHGLQCQVLDLRNSGDTAGPRDQVVGYGAFAFG